MQVKLLRFKLILGRAARQLEQVINGSGHAAKKEKKVEIKPDGDEWFFYEPTRSNRV